MAPPKGHYYGGGAKKGQKQRRTLRKQAAHARALTMADITAERTMLEIARLAMADRTAVWRDGKLLPVEDWPADQKALLEGFEVIVKNAAAGDGHTDTVHKVHLARKQGALDLLAKHFGLVTEKVEHTLSDELLARLDAIKARNRGKA